MKQQFLFALIAAMCASYALYGNKRKLWGWDTMFTSLAFLFGLAAV